MQQRTQYISRHRLSFKTGVQGKNPTQNLQKWGLSLAITLLFCLFTLGSTPEAKAHDVPVKAQITHQILTAESVDGALIFEARDRMEALNRLHNHLSRAAKQAVQVGDLQHFVCLEPHIQNLRTLHHQSQTIYRQLISGLSAREGTVTLYAIRKGELVEMHLQQIQIQSDSCAPTHFSREILTEFDGQILGF